MRYKENIEKWKSADICFSVWFIYIFSSNMLLREKMLRLFRVICRLISPSFSTFSIKLCLFNYVYCSVLRSGLSFRPLLFYFYLNIFFLLSCSQSRARVFYVSWKRIYTIKFAVDKKSIQGETKLRYSLVHVNRTGFK